MRRTDRFPVPPAITGFQRLFVIAVLIPFGALHAAPPYLTGVVEDGDSQIIEMPRLPGEWQRTVAWMAPEGSSVKVGDLVVQFSPGTLISQEEAARTDLERKQLEAMRWLAETELAIMDAETAVLQAESAVRLARIDANIPAGTIRQLDYDNFQLTLATAEQVLERAHTTLTDKQVERAGVKPVTDMRIAKAETEWIRLSDAIDRTKVYANREGLVIYGENPFTGSKIFPGMMLQPTVTIAEVASRKKLQFHFWVHEADILKLPVGARITVTPDAMPQRSVTATVEWTSKQATTREEWSKGGYFEMRAVPVEAGLNDFIPGMAVMSELQ